MALVDIRMDLFHVTEQAAIAASKLTGKMDKMEADRLATEAMRESFNALPISGRIVIGEGERDDAPMLFIGEEVGTGGVEIDIAVDPLEGTNLCAYNRPESVAVLGVGPRGSLMHAPDTYMDKIIVGIEVTEPVSLDYTPEQNLEIIASGHGIPVEEVTIMLLKRKRNMPLVHAIVSCGARVKLINDGDVCAGINALFTSVSGVHALMGIGAAPEGVISACSVRALDGQMFGRLMPYDSDMEVLQSDVVDRMKTMGIDDIDKIYRADELAKGDDILFVATGVTAGNILSGVKRMKNYLETETLILSTKSRTMQKVLTRHLMGTVSGKL